MGEASIEIERINNERTFAQVLDALGSTTNGSSWLCPIHQDTDPSLHIFEDGAYCFGCDTAIKTPFRLAELALKKSVPEVIEWFKATVFKNVAQMARKTFPYQGPVDPRLVRAWADTLQDNDVIKQRLHEERLITYDNIKRYQLGWRAGWKAYSIPFYKSELGASEIVSVQFRKTGGGSKYIGLPGHYTGSIMNAFVLEQELPYLVVLLGSFDGILALQDGIPAVSLNGAFPFRNDQQDAVKAWFNKSIPKFVVSDQTPSEYASAQKLAKWIDADMRYFSPLYGEQCKDYIDYRKASFTPQDFERDILNIKPLRLPDNDAAEAFYRFIIKGDPINAAPLFVNLLAKGRAAHDLAVSVALFNKPEVFTKYNWTCIQRKLFSVVAESQLYDTITYATSLRNTL